MPLLWILVLVLVLAITGLILGRARALAVAGGDPRRLHSLPHYHGWSVALWVLLPTLTLVVLWLIIQPVLVDRQVSAMIPDSAIAEGGSRSLVLADVRRIAAGLDLALATGGLTAAEATAMAPDVLRERLGDLGIALGADPAPEEVAAAERYRAMTATGGTAMTFVALALAIAGLLIGLRRITVDFRARNGVETTIRALLIAASSIAVLTTVGIIYSMLAESVRFFTLYPVQDFFFGLTWSPNFRGNSELGMIPLLWGTLYITLISMLVAVPLGLFSAIYLAEYASPRTRSIVKPLIEVIAGIPTVVFGLFALVTVGPFLRDWFAQPLGLGDSGSSVMTAGIVIGILNIPFVSSLSDDIINAVPQSMRDGSYGLGATRSETIRQVILPAALPGIVGAILLAGSRAIGETMIVSMGAGAAAKLDLNPFEAMTTITVKIVGQLTGDTNFASPETLVAFALGMTLFVITLALNVLALWIVRTFREQYE
jgi:phosphate transport system permease protein